MLRLLIALLFIGLFVSAYGQCEYTSPIDTPIRLSGSFGELRTTHFHAGLDIKSPDGLVGHPVLAVCDATISRIAVSPSGYGNVLYLDHVDGYRSVYAHLHKFTPILDSIVHSIQYGTKRFKIDSTLLHLNIKVKQGQLIGYLGNSGYSFGPHLHFEIRKALDDTPIHPQYFGFLDQDTRGPVVKSVELYGLSVHSEEVAHNTISIKTNSSRIELDTIYIPAWRGAAGVQAYDPADLTQNKNGIFKFSTYLDGKLIYQTQTDSLSIKEKNEIKTYIDYAARQDRSATIQKGYRYPVEHYSVYDTTLSGVFSVFKHKARDLKIVLEDFQGNQTEIHGAILRSESASPVSTPYNYYYRPDSSITIDKNNFRILLPAGASAIPLRFSIDNKTSSTDHLVEYTIGADTIPILIPGRLHYVDPNLSSKHRWIYKSGTKWSTVNTKNDANGLSCSFTKMGTYAILLDTIAPEIKWNLSPKNSKIGSRFSAKILYPKDYPRDRKIRYDLKINGQWALLKYDPRTDLLTHTIDQKHTGDELEIEISVTDDVKNTSTITKTIKNL